MTVRGEGGMADGIDTAVHPPQASGLLGARQMRFREAEVPQLPVGHDSMLLLRQIGQLKM